MPTKILPLVAFVILAGCHSHVAPVEVEPVVFSHADEMVCNDTFIILADRRVFAVMAFLNACGYDEQPSGIPMHPVRVRTREAIRLKTQSHADELNEWKRYYRKKALPNFCYLNYALSLSDDYPFKRIRPDSELGYRSTARKLADFPAILNSFWETVGLQQIWNQVAPHYRAEISKYDLDKMAGQLAFVWEYLRLDRRDRFTFVSVPNLLDAHYHAIGARYEEYWYMVESPGAHSYDLNVHEYLHSFINPLVETNYGAHRQKLEAYFLAGKEMPLVESYGDPVSFASECLVRALDHRLHIVMEDNPKETKRRENIVNSRTQAGLLLTEPFYRLLADYEQSELNFEEFVSEMLERLPEYHD